MLPHSVAMINIMSYFLQGGSGSSFRVLVKSKDYDEFNMSVSGGGSSYTINSSKGGWTCVANVRVDGNKVQITRHQHHWPAGHDMNSKRPTQVNETCYIELARDKIDSGSIRGSSIRDGSFSGKIESPKKIRIDATTTGRSYYSEIS